MFTAQFHGSERGEHVMFGNGDGLVTTSSVVDAAIEAGALFEVHKTGVALPDGTVPLIERGKYKGEPEVSQTYRVLPDGSLHRLAPNVSPGYPASNYLQLVQMAEDLFPGTCGGLEVFGQGRRLMFTQDLGHPVDLGGGDTIRPHLLWTGSLDQSWASQAAGLAYRGFCANQLPLSDAVFKVKRTTNHDVRLFEKGVMLATLLDRFEAFAEQARTLRAIPVPAERFRVILERLLPEPPEDASTRAKNAHDRKVAGIRFFWTEEVDRVGHNAWAVYNAIQSYEFHHGTKGDTERQVELVVDNDQPLTNRFTQRILATV